MSRESRILREPREHDSHEPHSVSLKVLRLSRPALVQQQPLPREGNPKIPQHLSLAHPFASPNNPDFALSPLLSLPQAFGSAYVGERFSCSLCANNELPANTTARSVSGIRINAEIQTPSQSVPLELYSPLPEDEQNVSIPGSSLQKIVRCDLKEEGNHVLAVNVSYTEATQDAGGHQTSGKTRSFRKLYQFLAQPCLGVRTKATELEATEMEDKSLGPYGRSSLLRYVLEAQLENLSEGLILIESASLQTKLPFRATSLNWDAPTEIDDKMVESATLNTRDVYQIAFLVEQQRDVADGLEELKTSLKHDGRTVLGQLSVSWRSSMGEKGSLTTGSLMSRRRAS